MKLTFEERNSATWATIRKYLDERLDVVRRQNDNALDPTETATLRGRIQEVKRLIALDKDDEQE